MKFPFLSRKLQPRWIPRHPACWFTLHTTLSVGGSRQSQLTSTYPSRMVTASFLTSSPTLHTTWHWTSIFCVKAHTGDINTTQKPGSKEQRVLCLRVIHRAFTQQHVYQNKMMLGLEQSCMNLDTGVCLKHVRHRSGQDGGYSPPILH